MGGKDEKTGGREGGRQVFAHISKPHYSFLGTLLLNPPSPSRRLLPVVLSGCTSMCVSWLNLHSKP